jgi:ubiquitin-like 1-activating enzyme E1 B
MSRAAATATATGCYVTTAKVLVVGAGGIGCELIKNLVLMGFTDVMMIDLDTIDYSNLNRQFLFRQQHVGQPKCTAARDAALSMPHDPNLTITAKQANIKAEQFDRAFWRSFDIVLSALDNVAARIHVNHECLVANVPLIESGTQGAEGQAHAIFKGRTSCYSCQLPPPPTTYPGERSDCRRPMSCLLRPTVLPSCHPTVLVLPSYDPLPAFQTAQSALSATTRTSRCTASTG